MQEGPGRTDLPLQEAESFGLAPILPLRGIDPGGGEQLAQGSPLPLDVDGLAPPIPPLLPVETVSAVELVDASAPPPPWSPALKSPRSCVHALRSGAQTRKAAKKRARTRVGMADELSGHVAASPTLLYGSS